MCTKWTRASLLMLAMTAAPAWAEDQGGADPSTKTLPAKASDTARANAFGQQGARMRAAHQAARAAAAQEARAAAVAAQATPPTPTRPAAAATAHASAAGVTNGFDRATAGSANGQGSTHRH
jgi:hypothetical protein